MFPLPTAHPEELWAALAVLITAGCGLYFLGRLVLNGARRRERLLIPATEYHRILLPWDSSVGHSPVAVSLAGRVAASQATIFVIAFLEVPRAISLDAAGIEGESDVLAALGSAAETIRREGHAVQTSVRRCRNARDELIRAGGLEGIDLVILSESFPLPEGEQARLRDRLACDLILVRGKKTA